MDENKKTEHYYLLPSGQKAADQLEGRTILGIGRNAFRNRVKNGVIKKITINKPHGYNDQINSTQW